MSFNLGSAHGEIVIDYNGAAVQQAMGDLNALGQTGDQLTKAGGLMAGLGAAIAAPLIGATNAAADFEFQMDAVNAALGGVDTTVMADLEQQALDLGAASKFSAGEVAGVQEALGKAGISGEQLLGGATQAVLDLSAATGEQLQPAAIAAAAAINLFGLDAEQSTAVADIFTAGLNNSSATLADFQRGVTTLGSSMSNLNQYAEDGEGAFRDTAAAVAYMNAQGLKAADAGVSLARGLENLATPTSDAAQLMTELGIAAYDMEGNFIGFPQLFDELNESMSGMSDQAREAALSTIFGAEAADVMNKAIKAGGDPLREYQALLESNGQAAEQAAIRQDNLRGTLEELGGAVNTAAIALGQPLLGPIRAAAEALTQLVQGFIHLDPAVQTFISTFGALSAILLTAGGGALLAAGQILRLGAAFSAAGLSLGKFALGFGLIGAALAAGILAYQTDFLGFRRAVDKALGAASKAVQTFGRVFDEAFAEDKAAGLNTLAAGIAAFGTALEAATGLDLTDQFRAAADAVQAFGDAWGTAMTFGFNPAAAALLSLSAAARSLGLEGVADALGTAGRAAQEFGAVFRQTSEGASAAGFNDVAASLIGLGDALEVVTGIPVSDAFRAAAEAVQVFGTSFASARAEGLDPFSASLVALRDGLTELTGINLAPAFDQLGASFHRAAEGVLAFGQAIQQGDFETAGQMLADLATTIGEGLSGIAVTITDWVLNVAAPAVMNFLGDAAAWILEKLNQAGVIIDNFVDWVLNVGLPAAGAFIGGTLVPWIQEKLAGLATVLDNFVDWTLNVGLPAAGDFVGDLAGWIREKLEGAKVAISDFTGWNLGLGLPGGTLGGAAGGAVGAGAGLPDLAAWIQEKLAAAAITVENFTGWSLTVSTPEGGVQVDLAGITASITEQVHAQLAVSPEVVAAARQAGTDLGNAIVEAFAAGMAGIVGGGAGGGAPAGVQDPLTVLPSIGDAFQAFEFALSDALIQGAETAIDEAGNKFEAWINEQHDAFWGRIGDAMRGLFDFATGTQTAQAAPGEAPGLDAAAMGEDLGTQFGEVFTSAEFTEGFNAGLETVDDTAFAGIATGLLTKVSESISTAMLAEGPGTASETGAGTSPIGGDMGTALVTAIATGLQTSIDAAPIEQFAAIGTSLVTKIQESISAAMTTTATGGQTGRVGAEAAGGLGAGLVASLATSIASSITEAPIESFAAIGTALQTKISEVLSTAMQAGAAKGTPQAGLGGTGGASGIGQAIAQSIADAVGQADFGVVATSLQTALTTPIQTAMTQVGTTIATSVAQWSAEFSNGFTNITTVVTNGMTTVTNAVTTGMTAATTAVVSALSQITAHFQAFATEAQAAGQQAGDGFHQGLTAGLQAAVATAQAMAQQVIAALQSAADGAYAAGAAVGEGFAAGMEASLGRVQAAAAAMADAAAAGLAAAAQIASPSKVTFAMGLQFGEGFALGVEGSFDAAGLASYAMGNEAVQALLAALQQSVERGTGHLRRQAESVLGDVAGAASGGAPITIETNGTVELDGEALGSFTVETVLGGLVGAQRTGGRRRGRTI